MVKRFSFCQWSNCLNLMKHSLFLEKSLFAFDIFSVSSKPWKPLNHWILLEFFLHPKNPEITNFVTRPWIFQIFKRYSYLKILKYLLDTNG